MTLTVSHSRFEVPVWDLDLYRGDSRIIDIELTTEGGTPDLTDCDFKMQIKPDEDGRISPSITVTGNVVRLYFAPELTANAGWRRGKYDVQMTRNGIVTTILYGKVRLTEDVTK